MPLPEAILVRVVSWSGLLKYSIFPDEISFCWTLRSSAGEPPPTIRVRP